MKIFGRKDPDPARGTPSIVLIISNGEEDPWGRFSHELGPGEDVIGRDEGCSIQVNDPQISRRHVSIDYKHDVEGFVARDLGSANGTLVNGQRLTEAVVLAEGDVIDVGNSRLVFTSRKIEGQVGAPPFKAYGEGRIGTMPGNLRPPSDDEPTS